MLKHKSLCIEIRRIRTTNVELEMYDYTTNNWSHWNSKEGKIGSYTRKKTFDRFATKDSCAWNSTHNTSPPMDVSQSSLLFYLSF